MIVPVDPDRVKNVFQAALALSDPSSRAALLDCECGVDGELRKHVETLLQGHADLTATLMQDHSATDIDTTVNSQDASVSRNTEDAAAPKPRFAAGSKLGKYDITRFLAAAAWGKSIAGLTRWSNAMSLSKSCRLAFPRTPIR